MPEREKVIKGLGEALTLLAEYVPCEGYLGYAPGACLDAIELLKAQEPRVMALEKIKALPDCVFLEDRDISNVHSIKTISRPALPQLVFVNTNNEECIGFRGPDGDTYLVTSRYGAEWRCWTSRPTDEQREAIPWN